MSCKGHARGGRRVLTRKSLRLAVCGGLTAIAGLSAGVPAAAQDLPPIAARPDTLDAPLSATSPRIDAITQGRAGGGLVRVIARVARPSDAAPGAIPAGEVTRAAGRLQARARSLGAAHVEPIGGLPLTVLEVSPEQLRTMAQEGLVSDVVVDVADPPTLQDSIPLIHADAALTHGAGGTGQTVAILDTGVAAAHPFFGGRVVAEACFSSNSTASSAATVCPGGVTSSVAAGSAAPCGVSGCDHGTHVAGIAAGSDANRRGVAPQARIVAIQVFSRFADAPGGPTPCANVGSASPCVLSFTSDQIRGLQQVFDWRQAHTFAAVNMSLGGGNATTCDADSRKGLIDQLRAAGIATVVASGNGGSSTGVGAPGCITTAVTIGNTTKADAVNTSSDSAAVVDLLAPGTSITSSVPGGGFAAKTGTSMATPHVTGAIAALRSVRPDLTVDQAVQALQTTGVAITDGRNALVRSRIDVDAAVQSVTTPTWSGAIWRFTGTACTGQSCPGWQRLDNNTHTVAIAAGAQLYQLHQDGRIWRSTGTPCNGDACPGWQMLDNNPMTATIAAGGDKLYQLHKDGRVWRFTGTTCNGQACPGWQMLDNNPMTVAITAGGDKLYQLHKDGRIWRSTDAPCTGQSCPGWQMLDNNPMTAAIVAGGDTVYQLHKDGRIWHSTGAPCNGDACLGWQMLDNNPMAAMIAASGDKLYQLHKDGRIWRSTGAPCNGQACPGWQMLDNNPMAATIAAGGDALYQLHKDGRVWRFTGTACNGQACPGWQMLDNNPRTRAIAAGPSTLFQLHGAGVAQRHATGLVWQSTGAPCAGNSCPGWDRLDNNAATTDIRSASGFLYQLHGTGHIFRATLTPCLGDRCPGWQMLDNNGNTAAIAAGGGQVYQLHKDGKIWRSTGVPCQGNACPGWQMLDNNGNTAAIAAGGGQVYQLHKDGKIWRSTGAPCQGNACPGWQMLDNNGNTAAIAAGSGQVYQLHKDGKIWRSTGVPCQGNACPGWQMLDNNGNTIAIAANGGQLYQLHKDGKIWRSTGVPCQGNACPGWQMLDNNVQTRTITAGGDQLYQLHKDGRIWRSTGAPCNGDACPGWQMLDNNPQTRQLSEASAP